MEGMNDGARVGMRFRVVGVGEREWTGLGAKPRLLEGIILALLCSHQHPAQWLCKGGGNITRLLLRSERQLLVLPVAIAYCVVY